MAEEITFEALRAELDALDVPSGEARRLLWVVDQSLGAAKTSTGDFEIFLVGDPLIARSAIVRQALEHGAWRPATGGELFTASRVMLPAAPHYAPIAALIATELARAGLAEGGPVQPAFDEVEPIIELAIRRGALSEEAALGLFSELLVLRTMLRERELSLEEKAVVLGAWRGWQQGRDFVLGRSSLEVKATKGLTSTHAFSGLHQVEERPLEDGDSEALHVLSLGLQETPDAGETLPQLVDSLLEEIGPPLQPGSEPSPLQAQLLAWIQDYGSAGRGYRHQTMRDWPQHQVSYALSFTPRLYRIRDEAMRLLARSVVEDTFVRPDSLLFEVAFPAKVSAFNPAEHWRQELGAMVDGLLGGAAAP